MGNSHFVGDASQVGLTSLTTTSTINSGNNKVEFNYYVMLQLIRPFNYFTIKS